MTNKIVIIEDDKMLALIYKMFLEELGYQEVGVFSNAEEFFTEIDTLKPELVLIDISLSGKMSGLEATTILQNKYYVPTIYITGHTEDEIIQEAIRSNPYGYLIKPIEKNMLRVTIDLALSQFKNIYQDCIEKEIVNKIDIGVLVCNKNGEIYFVNETAKALLAIPKNFLQKKISEFLYGEEFVFDNKFVQKILNDNITEIEFNRIDIKKTFHLNFSVEKDAETSQPLIFSFLHDITESRTSQDKQKYIDFSLRTIFDASKEAIFIIDKNFSLVDFNETASVYSDEIWKTKLIKGKKIFSIFPNLTNHEKKEFTKLFNNSFDGISHYLDRTFTLNNESKYFNITIFPIFSDEKIDVALIGISWYDNTYEVEIEKELEELRLEIKPLFDNSFQRFYLSDLQYKIIAFNKAAEEIIFKEQNHVLKKGDSILNFVPSEIGEEGFKEMFKKALNYEHAIFKLKIISEIGEYWNETHLDPILNAKGEVTRILIWTIDITEQEKNLLALQESQERYSLIAVGANDGLWDWDLRTNQIYLSPRWKNLIGYEDDELPNKFGIHDSMIHPDDREYCKNKLTQYLDGEIDIYSVEVRLKHKAGHYIWVLERGYAQKDGNNKPIRIAGSITDITTQKNIEEKLRKTNKQLLEERKMFMEGDLLVYRLSITGSDIETKYLTENIINILGYTNLDFVSGKIKFEDIIFPDDKIVFINDLEKIKQQQLNNFEFTPIRFIKKTGEYIWIKNFTIILNKQKDAFDMLGYCLDLSSLIDAKPLMNEQQRKILEFFQVTSESIIGIQKNKIIESNNPAQKLFGFSEKEFTKQNISEIFICENETVEDRFKRKVLENKHELVYWKCKHKDTSVFDAEISLNPIEHDDNTIIYLIIRDISERKLMEEELKKSEQRYSNLLNAIPDLFFVMDSKGNYLDYKADEKSPLYVNPNTIINKTLFDFFPKEKANEMLDDINTVIKTDKVKKIVYSLPSNIGERTFEARMSKMDNTKILSIVRDITEEERK